jgi:hypothetical protein
MMTEASRVSVIMPVFNTSAYTAEVMTGRLLPAFEGVGFGRMFSVAADASAPPARKS